MNRLKSAGARCARSAIAAVVTIVMAMVAMVAENARARTPTFSPAPSAAAPSTHASAQIAHVEAVDAAYRGGRGTQSDAIAIRTELERIGDRQRQNARDLAIARARLARWIGEAAAQPLAQRSPFDARFDAHPDLPETQAALQRKLDAHPALKRLPAQVQLSASRAFFGLED